ncbi:MAG: glycogen synthase GlgA [Candidatus Gastranaerophilales bacterium]|nr:glycogen synthase GlgA [Candidatus Gastranaerophilales bacterium]
MRILFASAEVAPFAKVGGLGDVAGSLPKAINELGNDIRVIMPLWGCIDKDKFDLQDVPDSTITLKLDAKNVSVSLKQTKLPDSDVIVYFVVNNEYFGSLNEVYPKNCEAEVEQERFLVFGIGSLKLMEKISFKPNIIHCNDWHTANIPVYLKGSKNHFNFYTSSSVLFSIHNLAYQGIYGKEILDFANISSEKVFTPDGLEFFGDVNWMKGAIVYSDQINAVSKTYAHEIQIPEFGEGLDGLLGLRNYKLTGILNGIDYNIWNPKSDSLIQTNYSADDLSGKKECKKALQKKFKLDQKLSIPLLGIVSRLVDQKGLDLLANIANDLKDSSLQLIVLGTGDEKYEKIFRKLTKNTSNIKALIGYDNNLAHQIYAGCDMFLMPSRFEPCGLGQLIALRYGTVPIVRKTGGLADTIIDYTADNELGNGFIFDKYSSDELLDTINKAIKLFKTKKIWKHIVINAMNCEFSWQKSALEYQNLYKNLIKRR